MKENNTDELRGRIDGVAAALLRLAAMLEMDGVIDGPRVSAMWRSAAEAKPHNAGSDTTTHQAAREVLLQLAAVLDDARAGRGLRQ